MAKKQRTPKRKTVKFELIDQYTDKRTKTLSQPYTHLDAMRVHHPHLAEAKIAMVWMKGQKADKDGRLTLGKCIKVGDREKELHPFDFIILLNQEMWQSYLNDAQKDAIVDHELNHAQVARDKEGQPKKDDRGRICWRIKKHEIEEFRDVVKRHGMYKSDIEEFIRAVQEGEGLPLFPEGDGGAVAGQVGAGTESEAS